jgi:hypothetical protein
MIKTLIFLLSFSVYGGVKHPIYNHILKLKPNMSKPLAMRISNLLYKYSKKYSTDPHISVAIGMTETSIMQRNRKELYIEFNGDYTKWKFKEGYTDICMFQFHSRTIRNKKLDASKLHLNLEYCIEQHMKLLKSKTKICKKHLGNEAWSCYHSFTDEKRKIYQLKVEKNLLRNRSVTKTKRK